MTSTVSTDGSKGVAGKVFQIPPQQRWKWLCFADPLVTYILVRQKEGAAVEEGIETLANSIQEGDLCSIEEKEEKAKAQSVGGDGSGNDEDREDSDDDDEEEDDNDEADRPPQKLLVLANGEAKMDIVEASEVLELVHKLAQKALIVLSSLVIVNKKLVRPRSEEQDGTIRLRLTVKVHVSLCVNEAQPHLCIRQRKAELPKLLSLCNVLLASRASPLSSSLPQETLEPQEGPHMSRPRRRRLAAIFEEASRSPQSMPSRAPPSSYMAIQRQEQATCTKLPDEVLGLSFAFLTARDIRSLGDTCHFFKEATAAIVPGLKARLFPHQQRGLQWMLAREEQSSACRRLPHPAWESLVCHEEEEGSAGVNGERAAAAQKEKRKVVLYINMMTGSIVFDPKDIPTVHDVGAGIVADEMGLGKTCTALSLILKTRGLLPSPGGGLAAARNDASSPNQGTSDAAAFASPNAGFGGARFSFRSPQHRRREVDPRTLRPCSATLIICPAALLQHWKEQIEYHCETWALGSTTNSNGLGEVEEGGGGEAGHRHRQHVLVDDGYMSGRLKPLPSAEVLAKYAVVVVSKERLRQEWQTGKPMCVLEERTPKRYRQEDATPRQLSALLQLLWLRIIVDEGHSLGSLALTNEDLMTKRLQAERRWVMTGTPHRHDGTDLLSLRGLLCFLRIAPFGLWHDDAWGKLITAARPGASSSSSAIAAAYEVLAQRRLISLLRHIMIRHTKAGIPEIPTPIWHHTKLRMSKLEVSTYNTLVSLVQANLLTTGLEGGSHPAGRQHPDSIINPMNRSHALVVLYNVRLACCGGGKQIVSLDQATVVETLNLAKKFSSSSSSSSSSRRDGGSSASLRRWHAQEEEREAAQAAGIAKIANYLRNLRNGVNSQCDACGVPLLIMLITPCLHLLCCGCMKGRNNICVRCETVFDVDEFQLLQPGLSIQWREDDLNVLLPTPAPSSTPTVLQQQEEEEEEEDDGSWTVISKAWHMITILKQYQEQQQQPRRHPPLLPLKAIVFSQFRAYLNSLAPALKTHGFTVGRFYDKARLRDLAAFKDTSPNGVQILLIGKEGSHGLDLSMATHVFLMDEIFDKNLQDQVVSRAYRMGAKASVIVEKLVMEGTVEEAMAFLSTADGGDGATARSQLMTSCSNDTDTSSTVSLDGGGGNGDDEEDDNDGDDLASLSSSSTSSSLSAMGRGSWGRAAAGSPTAEAPASMAKQRRNSSWGRRRRSSGGRSGDGGGSAEVNMNRLQYLLQSLQLIQMPGRKLDRGRVLEKDDSATFSSSATASSSSSAWVREEKEDEAATRNNRRVRFAGDND